MELMTLGIIGGLILAFLLWLMGTYNRLVHQQNLLKEALSGISVQQKRRYDLIPNLVNTVKGYSIHEKDLLENVTKLRTSAMRSDASPQTLAETENQLSGTLKTLFAVSENYPDLKANQNFMKLQEELSSIENAMQLARRYYNGAARNYNTTIRSFPSVLVARWFCFGEEEYFKLSNQAEAEAPTVKF